MWLFTRHGFYSCVDSQRGMAVRARVKKHLTNLKKVFPAVLHTYKVITTEDTDYRYRLILDYADFTLVVSELSQQIDYPNFKDACKKDPEYSAALLQVWMAMQRLQINEGKPRGRSFPGDCPGGSGVPFFRDG